MPKYEEINEFSLNYFVWFLDLEEDLTELRKWLHGVETQLDPLSFRDNLDNEALQIKLKEHQVSVLIYFTNLIMYI